MTFRIAHSVGCVAIGLCSAARAQITYTVTEITTLGGPSSNALALNNNGAVVGISNTAAGPNVARAFRWINGTIIDLGTLGGPSAEAFDINDAGQITGRAETADSIEFNETFHTFLWEDGTMTDLGTSGGQSSRGWAINSRAWLSVHPKSAGTTPRIPVGHASRLATSTRSSGTEPRCQILVACSAVPTARLSESTH